MVREPEIVPSASLAVVPAMLISVCMTEIALTMFPKDRLFASTVIPSSDCTSVSFAASAIRRSISVLVPP